MFSDNVSFFTTLKKPLNQLIHSFAFAKSHPYVCYVHYLPLLALLVCFCDNFLIISFFDNRSRKDNSFISNSPFAGPSADCTPTPPMPPSSNNLIKDGRDTKFCLSFLQPRPQPTDYRPVSSS